MKTRYRTLHKNNFFFCLYSFNVFQSSDDDEDDDSKGVVKSRVSIKEATHRFKGSIVDSTDVGMLPREYHLAHEKLKPFYCRFF